MKRWDYLPTWWNRVDPCPLIELRGGRHANLSQAALRILLALAVSDRDKASYELLSTLSSLEEITGLSRSMVLRGIHRAEAAGLITYESGGPRKKSKFSLVHPELSADSAGGWAKIPVKQVRTKLRDLPSRGEPALIALKIYALLLANRPNDNTVVRLSHERMQYKTGCQPRSIRAALSHLANIGFIHINKESDDGSEKGRSLSTPYNILGELDARRSWSS